MTVSSVPRPAQHLRAGAAAITVLTMFSVGLSAWRGARTIPKPESRPSVAGAVSVVRPRTAPAVLEAPGALQAAHEVTLAPETSGRVVAINFEGGARVAPGALLVQLDDRLEQADRAAADARAEYARQMYERSLDLMRRGFEAKMRLDERATDYQLALAALRQLEARISQKQVRAPFGGELGVRRVYSGQYLDPGDAIATLTQLDILFVNFCVAPEDVSKVRLGARVDVVADTFPDRIFTAKVNAIDPAVRSDHSVSVQAIMPNPGRALRPGLRVTARLDLPPQPNALLVPAAAIRTTAQGHSVMVVRGPQADRGGIVQAALVKVDRRVGDAVVITSGLKSDDVVVTSGQPRVQPGARITVAAQAGAQHVK